MQVESKYLLTTNEQFRMGMIERRNEQARMSLLIHFNREKQQALQRALQSYNPVKS